MIDDMNFIEVLGSRMAYRRIGPRGAPIALFLHGNPTSSYIWRNIMSQVAGADCIAPDLVGFGRSDKPVIDYRFADHVRYLDAFVDRMGLDSFYLVAQDWGTALAFELAARRPERVRGLAFMEFIRPFKDWNDFHQRPQARALFQQFRTPGVGEKLIIEDNVFIEQILPASIHRKLSREEMEAYRQPFLEPSARLPVWRLPNELPVGGEPDDVWSTLSAAHAALRESTYPKVLFHGTPGALVSPEFAQHFAAGLTNCTVVSLGDGAHYLQEDHPEAIAEGVSALIARAEQAREVTAGREHPEITITYCGPCGYLAKAKSAAAALEGELDVSPKLVAGAGGVFRVSIGDEIVITRRKGYFPDPGDIVTAVRAALDHTPASAP
ncbi:MAG: haloalkane dehalogenase [Rhizobium sp.]|nr:MAG: haloalkane dehalogenase [Rhizobium sp.]